MHSGRLKMQDQKLMKALNAELKMQNDVRGGKSQMRDLKTRDQKTRTGNIGTAAGST